MKKLVCVILCLSALCIASLQGFGFVFAAPVTTTSLPDEPPAAGEATAAEEATATDAPQAASEETTGKQTVVRKTDTLKDGANFFIVGNPDCYPFEYYDPQTGNYEGLLPLILNDIAEANGFSARLANHIRNQWLRERGITPRRRERTQAGRRPEA